MAVGLNLATVEEFSEAQVKKIIPVLDLRSEAGNSTTISFG
jgi:hypothetical protein